METNLHRINCLNLFFFFSFRTFGTRQSLKLRSTERMLRSFERKENATARKKNQKDDSGSLENYSFDREILLREAQNAIDNETSINWSELALTTL